MHQGRKISERQTRKHLDKVVAGAGGISRKFHVAIAVAAGQYLSQRPVAADGVDAQRRACSGVRPGNLGRVPGIFGQSDLIGLVQISENPLYFFYVLPGPVFDTGGRIDDKQVLQIAASRLMQTARRGRSHVFW